MKEYTFENILEINSFLESSNISESRGLEERYFIVNYLNQFKDDIFTEFPVKLIYHDKPDFRILSQNRTNDQIVEKLNKSQEGLFGPGYFGKAIERKWIQGIYRCIINKTQKLNKNGFDKFPMNWLLICDKQTRAFLDKEYVLKKLHVGLKNYFNEKDKYIFDRIIIQSGKYFYLIEVEHFPIINIISRNIS